VLVRRGGASPVVERGLRILVVAEVAQGAIGYTQYFTGVPVGLVAAHVLGATLVWIAAVEAVLRTSVVEGPSPSPVKSSGRPARPVPAPA
jgi:cytochrome c oxidase assembly protein subunit 15